MCPARGRPDRSQTAGPRGTDTHKATSLSTNAWGQARTAEPEPGQRPQRQTPDSQSPTLLRPAFVLTASHVLVSLLMAPPRHGGLCRLLECDNYCLSNQTHRAMRTELGKSWKGLGALGPPARPGTRSHFHSAIGNIYSSNLCKGVVAEGAGPSSHGSVLIVKGLWGTPTPEKGDHGGGRSPRPLPAGEARAGTLLSLHARAGAVWRRRCCPRN